MVRMVGPSDDASILRERNRSGVSRRFWGTAASRHSRVRSIEGEVGGGLRCVNQAQREARRDFSAIATKQRLCHKIGINKVNSIPQPILHQVDFALITAPARLHAPSALLAS